MGVSGFLLFALISPAFAQGGFSLIKGTVFTPEGRALPGAKITIIRTDIDPKQQKKTRKEAASDRIGEFAFRMDPGPAKFRLTAEAKGFVKHERDVEVTGDERIDLSVVMKQAK